MKDKGGPTWAQIRYWLICVGLIAVGVAATIWGGPWDGLRPIFKELGPGIFTAGILASLVEPFFRREFARDAFLASFRYVLPEEFKEEVEKIIRFEFVATKQVWGVQIEKIGEDVVRVTTTLERTLTNKSKTTQPLQAWIEAEDYDFPNGPTTITRCSIEEEGTGCKLESTGQIFMKGHYQDAHTDTIELQPNKTAKIAAKTVHFRRANGDIYETFRVPIINPEIEVTVDGSEFDHSITFGTYGDVSKSEFRNHYTLSGVYFPGQFMVVRWWPKQAADLKL